MMRRRGGGLTAELPLVCVALVPHPQQSCRKIRVGFSLFGTFSPLIGSWGMGASSLGCLSISRLPVDRVFGGSYSKFCLHIMFSRMSKSCYRID